MYIDEYPLCSIFTALFPADPQSCSLRKARHAQLYSNHDSDNDTDRERERKKTSTKAMQLVSRAKEGDVSFLVRFVVHIERNLENPTSPGSVDLNRRGSIGNRENTRRLQEEMYVVPGISTPLSFSVCRVCPFLLNIISPSCYISLQLFTFSTAESTYRIHRTIPSPRQSDSFLLPLSFCSRRNIKLFLIVD